jgi:hypothetical protein
VPHGSGDLNLWGASPSRHHGSLSSFDRSGVESSGLGPRRLIVPLSPPPLSSEIVTSEAAREGVEAAMAAGSTIPAERIDSGAVMMVVGSIPTVSGADPSTMGVGRTPYASEGGGQSSEASRKCGHPKVSRYVHAPLLRTLVVGCASHQCSVLRSGTGFRTPLLAPWKRLKR